MLIPSCLTACALPGRHTPADLVFRGGGIYTVNEAQPWAEAVAIRDGVIVYVGSDRNAGAYIGDRTEVVQLGGKILLPGFHDSHMHPMRAGNRFLRCQLEGLAWPDEVLAELSQCEKELEPGQWLRGVNLDASLFESGQLHRSQLDAIAGERPAFVTNGSGFIGWANSAALDQAGIDNSTPEPENGEIERKSGNNEPTGVLKFEGTLPVYGAIPEPEEAELRKALALSSQMANSFGITSSREAATYPENWSAFVAADRAGELKLRIQASQYWLNNQGLKQITEIKQRQTAHVSPYLQADSVKLFLDGSLIRERAAALIEPYVNSAEHGQLREFGDTALVDIVQALDRANLDVHMHAVGDRAVRTGLDAIEFAITNNPDWDRRPHMAHLVLVHPDDLPRFAELGVTADYQALWAYLNAERQAEVDNIGPERAERMIAIREALDSGARVVLGSDWISESMNPLYSIQIAVTRRPPDGNGPAWLPEQRISLEQAIRAYTIDGAWLARHEQLTGSIEVGKAADLVLLEKNLFEIDPMEISRVRVLRTLLNGKTVYRRTSSQP